MKPRTIIPIFSKRMLKYAAFAFMGSVVGIPTAYAEPLQAVAPAEASTVTGVVVDSEGEPLIGATVLVKGTNTGAATDIEGRFSIKAAPGQVLIITYVGYQQMQITVANGVTNLGNIPLAADSQVLDDVVVIGYGTAKKGDITSAVASVKADEFTQGKIGDAAELIKGKVAGLSITNSSGNPTAGSSIMLRGISTVQGSVQPLVLVDGIEGSLNTVAPENIASIDVLKDASAAAIYGTRGANGVILITTKSGQRDEKATVTYTDYFSFSKWAKRSNFMDTHDVIYGLTSFNYEGYDTDWLDAISRKAGFKHNHSLSVAGGHANSTYAANVQYSKDLGMLRDSDNERLRMQLDYTQYLWNDILKFNFNALISRQKYSQNEADYAYRQAIIRNPSEPLKNEDGSWFENLSGKQYYYNPYAMQEERDGNVVNNFYQITGNVAIEPIKGWETNVTLSMNNSNTVSELWVSPRHYSLVLQNDYNGSASKGESSGLSKSLEVTSRYRDTWNGVHRFEGLVGYSWLSNEYEGFNAGNGNFPTEAFKYNNLGLGTLLTEKDRHAWMGSSRSDDKLVGFFARVSYGYDNRYNVLASIRHEGSSKFGENHKWATFPSISAGWTISNESFMERAKEWVNNLRLRVGYGVTGITPNDNYLSMYMYDFDPYGDVLGSDGEWHKTLMVSQNPNKDLKWETSRELNVGVDFGFFDNRLTGSIDFYHKKTSDLLYYYDVPVPPNLYSATLYNVGDIRNVGVEIMVGGDPVRTPDFVWNTTLTLSHNSNKLLKLSNAKYQTQDFHEVGGLGEPISTPTHCMEVGHTLGDFWGLKSVGYNKDGIVLIEAKDADGNWYVKPWSTDDNVERNRQRLGNGLPDVIMGWNNTFRYKGFDLSLQFTGQFGYKILNAQRCFYENNAQAYNRLKSAADWLPAVDTNLQPVLNSDGTQLMVRRSNSMMQGFWSDHLENGDFFKLQNVTLGYTIPFKGGITKFISNLRIYGSVTNVFTITGYSGIDPEVDNYFLAPGIDYQDKYPTTRSFTVGLSATF